MDRAEQDMEPLHLLPLDPGPLVALERDGQEGEQLADMARDLGRRLLAVGKHQPVPSAVDRLVGRRVVGQVREMVERVLIGHGHGAASPKERHDEGAGAHGPAIARTGRGSPRGEGRAGKRAAPQAERRRNRAGKPGLEPERELRTGRGWAETPRPWRRGTPQRDTVHPPPRRPKPPRRRSPKNGAKTHRAVCYWLP